MALKKLNVEDSRIEGIYRDMRVDLMFTDVNPKTMAGGFVYFVSDRLKLGITQKQIMQALSISTRETLAKHYRRLDKTYVNPNKA